MNSLLALRICAIAMAQLACAGILLNRPALTWTGWLGFFVFAEIVGFKTRATFSGYEWALFQAGLLGMLFASLVSTAMVWAGSWHFVVEFDLFPKMRSRLGDDAWYAGLVLAATVVLSLIGRARRALAQNTSTT